MSLRIICRGKKEDVRALTISCDVRHRVMPSCVAYLLYHDTVNAHVYFPPGEVEHVHPAQSQTQHQEAQVLVPLAQIQSNRGQEQDGLEKTAETRCHPSWYDNINNNEASVSHSALFMKKTDDQFLNSNLTRKLLRNLISEQRVNTT